MQAYIAAMPGWKRSVGRRLDALIVRSVPDVRKAVKWNSPFYGIEGMRKKSLADQGVFGEMDGQRHGGTVYVLCFSDEGPDTGPHPVTQSELSAAFNPGAGWNVAFIERDRIQTRFHDHGAPAWLATIKRI